MWIKKRLLIILTILHTLFFTQICFAQWENCSLINIYQFAQELKNNKPVMKSLEAKCQSNDAPSCLLLGAINDDKKYYKKACDLNNSNGCLLFSYHSYQFNNKPQCKKQLPFLKKACDLNNKNGCLFLGNFYNGYCRYSFYQDDSDEPPYQYDIFVPTIQNIPLAQKYYEKSCSLEHSQACYRLANLYIRGHGVKQNLSKSVLFYQKACDNKDAFDKDWYKKQSCTILKNLQSPKGSLDNNIEKIREYADSNIQGNATMNKFENLRDIGDSPAWSIEGDIEVDIIVDGYNKYAN